MAEGAFLTGVFKLFFEVRGADGGLSECIAVRFWDIHWLDLSCRLGGGGHKYSLVRNVEGGGEGVMGETR